MSLKRSAPPTDPSSKIYMSQPIHDRESIFVAYYSPHPGLAPKELQKIDEGKTASHRILAWRTLSRQRTLAPTTKVLCDSGHDDDGEQWAGKRLENVLIEMDVQGSICVARWYGGVMLGPVRFKHIEDVAKEAVRVWREEEGGGGKRLKMNEPVSSLEQAVRPETMRPEELQRRKDDMIRTLTRRDESITTLRTLLDTKKAELVSSTSSKSSQPLLTPAVTISPSRKSNYDTMPFARLQALENARDATIQFLLKQIDKAEGDQEEAVRKKKQHDTVTVTQDREEIEEAWSDLAASMLDKDTASSAKPAQEDANG